MRRTKKRKIRGTDTGRQRIKGGKRTRKIRQNVVGRKRGGNEEGGPQWEKRKKEVRGEKSFFPFPIVWENEWLSVRGKKGEKRNRETNPPHPRLFFSGDKNSVGGNGTSFFKGGEGLLSRLFFLRPIRSGAKGERRRTQNWQYRGERKRGKEVLKPQSGRKSGWREWKLSRK